MSDTPPTCILTEADIAAGRDEDCTTHGHERPAVTRGQLLRPVTAGDLAMTSPGPGGYADGDIIGPEGSFVWVANMDEVDEHDGWIEVHGFENDSFAEGWVSRSDILIEGRDTFL